MTPRPQQSRLPTTDELAAAIKKLHIEGYAPSVAVFKAAHCNADSDDRWMQPDAICRHYGVSETVQGWAALCYQLTGLLTADRAFYLSHSYGTDKRDIAARTTAMLAGKWLPAPAHRQPPKAKIWKLETLGYSFARREYFREVIFVS